MGKITAGKTYEINALGKVKNKSRAREEKESRHSDWSHWYRFVPGPLFAPCTRDTAGTSFMVGTLGRTETRESSAKEHRLDK